MLIKPFSPHHLGGFDWQGKQAMMRPYMDLEVSAWAAENFAWTAYTNDEAEIIGSAGIAKWTDEIGVAWCVFSERITAYALPMTRAVSRALAASPYLTIHAHVAADHEKAAWWASVLGFRLVGRLDQVTLDREFDLYVRTR